jgi:LysR family transcriptional regulator, glycine cleavage system transcriptional activator
MSLPSLNAIRVFEAAARRQSFKDAADELALSPSAVSRHIRTLEETLGAELFERGHREVRLTPKATHYAARLTEAFRIIASATETISSEAPNKRRKPKRITLSVNASFMNLWLADRLTRFRLANPQTEVEIAIHDDSGRGGNPRADLRVLFQREETIPPSALRLVSLVVIPVCAPELLKGRHPLKKPADLAKHRLLHDNTTAWWEEWIAAEAIANVDAKSGPLFHDPSLAIREAVNGGGVALADNIMVEDLLRKKKLVAPFTIRRPIPYCYTLVERAGASTLPGIKPFRDWLLTEITAHKRAMGFS